MTRAMLVVAFVIAAACTTAVTPAPSPTSTATPAPTGTATASATRSPTTSRSPEPSPRPDPTAGPGTYTSVALGYRVTIPAGWYRSECVSGVFPGGDSSEIFFKGDPKDVGGTDTGFTQDSLGIRVEAANGMTPIEWVDSGKMGFFNGSHYVRTTFDGKEAAARVVDSTGKAVAYIVAARDRMYALSPGLHQQPSAATEAEVDAFMRSFHILSDTELADARATIASPSPAPERSAEDVADALAKGFSAKDTSALAAVAAPCLTHGIEQAGAAFRTTDATLADMQRSFASGLTVTLQARPLVDQTADYAAIRGRWTDPNGTQKDVTLMIRKRDGTWEWTGWIDMQPAR